jgi:D-psicose/D-tagatose/L-ribulose 3-epimerase
MKIGVSAFAWTADFKESHLEILPFLCDQGISALEIPMFDPARLPSAKIRRALKAAGLSCTVCAILPAGVNPISADGATRRKSVAHLIACIQACREMGATLIGGPVYAPIGYLPGRRRNEDDWKCAVDCLSSLTCTLETCEVTLALEPVNRSETFFLNTASDAMSLCETIQHPSVGVTIDTFHANIEEKNTAAAIRSLGKHLKHMHISENDRGLPGSGQLDFPAIIQALRAIGYPGLLMVEGFGYRPEETSAPGFLWADRTVSPEEIARGGASYLRSLLL